MWYAAVFIWGFVVSIIATTILFVLDTYLTHRPLFSERTYYSLFVLLWFLFVAIRIIVEIT